MISKKITNFHYFTGTRPLIIGKDPFLSLVYGYIFASPPQKSFADYIMIFFLISLTNIVFYDLIPEKGEKSPLKV